MTYGMKRDPWFTSLWYARHSLFPHADEIYDTGACMGTREKYARIYVCEVCTGERSKWFEAHPPPNYSR